MKKTAKAQKPAQKPLSMYGISRIDDDLYRTHAWRVSLRRRGKMHVKNFADQKYGGKRKALQQAKAYRDKLITKHPPITRRQYASAMRRNNTSGVVGVCRIVSRYYLKDGTEREAYYWEAIWPTAPGEHENVRFSVKKLGEEGAFKKACAARQRGLKRLKGYHWTAERKGIKNYGI